MTTKTVTMTLGKSTQGTHVYMEENSKPRSEKLFPTVYVQKHQLPDPPPQTIRVTIEVVG